MKKLTKSQKQKLNGGSCYKGDAVKGALDKVTGYSSGLGSVTKAKMCK